MSDLISRQAVEDLIMETDPFWCEGMTRAIFEGIKRLPTIEPKPSHDWNGWENGCGRTYDFEPKRGTWNEHTCINWHGWHCSVCDYETQRKTHYCPNCGADMRERSEE